MAYILRRDAFKVEIAPNVAPQEIASYFGRIPAGFYYAKVPTSAVALLQELTRIGFFVVDVNVTLEVTPTEGTVPDHISPDIIICDFDAARHADVASVAEDCFIYSRFHLDPQIPTEMAKQIKRSWIESCMNGSRGQGLRVAQWKGQTAGFLSIIDLVQNERRTRIIDLVGVDRTYQGLGIGRALTQHLLRQAVGVVEVVRVGTQVANIPSLRLYESTGFKIVETQYVLHAHF